MLIKSSNRKEAYTAILNQLLTDKRLYCNTCGKDWRPGEKRCCEDPQIGTNWDVARAVIAQCTAFRESRDNDHAAIKNRSMRWGLSLPTFFYDALDKYEKLHGRRLINSDKDINWLIRNFPQFAIPRRA